MADAGDTTAVPKAWRIQSLLQMAEVTGSGWLMSRLRIVDADHLRHG
jgi:hypothetical protein